MTINRGFKVGDRVDVKWRGSTMWEGPATITKIFEHNGDIQVKTDKGYIGAFGPEDLTLILNSLDGFKVGDKVCAPDRGKFSRPSTVTKIGKEFVFIRIDGSITTGGFYPQNLKMIKPMKLSVPSKVYTVAKTMAINLAKRNGTVNADQVQDEIAALGYKSTDLGNAAGVLFRGKNWKKVGTVKSARKGNHLREIAQWQYIGA